MSEPHLYCFEQEESKQKTPMLTANILECNCDNLHCDCEKRHMTLSGIKQSTESIL